MQASAYLVYGTDDSDRRAIIHDLLCHLNPNSPRLFFTPGGAASSSWDAAIADIPQVEVVSWELKKQTVQHAAISAAADAVIFLAPGNANPADVAEAFKAWCDHNHCFIARILTIIDCQRLMARPRNQAWIDACVHFSDVVLLNRRQQVPNAWIQQLQAHYKKAYYPAHFILVKKHRVPNPAQVLTPEARRLSLYFDQLIAIEEDGLDPEEQPEDLKEDPYIERLASGRRARPIPELITEDIDP